MDRTIHKIFPGNETIILSQFPIFPGVESIILRQFPLNIAIKFQAPLIPSPVRGHSTIIVGLRPTRCMEFTHQYIREAGGRLFRGEVWGAEPPNQYRPDTYTLPGARMYCWLELLFINWHIHLCLCTEGRACLPFTNTTTASMTSILNEPMCPISKHGIS